MKIEWCLMGKTEENMKVILWLQNDWIGPVLGWIPLIDKKDHPCPSNFTQQTSVSLVTTLKYHQYERELIFCTKNHFQISFVTETKLFEFHGVLYCLSLRPHFLDVFTAEKAIKSLATSNFPKSRWFIYDSLEEGSIFHLVKRKKKHLSSFM